MKFGWLILAVAWVTGCALFKDEEPHDTVRFHEQVSDSLPNNRARNVIVARTKQRITIDPYPTLTENDIFEARLVTTAGGDAVMLTFDTHGASLLTEMTTRLRGQYFVVMVNDRPVAAVLVEYPTNNGQLLLLGDMSNEESLHLVNSLKKLNSKRSDFGDVRMVP